MGSSRWNHDSRSWASVASLASLLGAASCGNDEPIAGSGTGGDEMPDDDEPGPRGPSCELPRTERPTLGGAHDVTARAQPAIVRGEVTFEGKPPPPAPEPSPKDTTRDASPTTRPLVAGGRSMGATTQSPHIHERWGESRKLELSYCITGITGDDAEREARYYGLVRSFFDTAAEWERVTGVNFVHIAADDTPDRPPESSPSLDGRPALRPDCANGTKAYFGVFTHPLGTVEALTNPVPQAWSDPDLEPSAGNLYRSIVLGDGLFWGGDESYLRAVLRHELGHVMGIVHEEVNDPHPDREGCDVDPDPRPLTPIDPHSIMTTPGCAGVYSDDAEILTDDDRLSGFFLHHTPRWRFETRPDALGYRYGGALGGGAEILWHSEGATAGTLWRPQVIGGMVSFVEEPFAYSSPATTPLGGWYRNQSEVVIPLRLGAPSRSGLLFYGPGPDVDDPIQAVASTAVGAARPVISAPSCSDGGSPTRERRNAATSAVGSSRAMGLG